MDKFYRQEPTARTAWRQAILMGMNTRTYKFALGQALLEFAHAGDDAPLLSEVAARYAWHLTVHAENYPQARNTGLRESDFLSVLSQESAATLSTGTPPERLVVAAVSSMPSMVMDKFHNLRDSGTVAHRFYELSGTGPQRRVILTEALRSLDGADAAQVLTPELQARWAIVEASFDAEIGPGLVSTGLYVDREQGVALDRRRRRGVAALRPALSGFQHGRCLYCHVTLESLDRTAHVEHVFPFHWMNRLAWNGPDLDSLWNLVLLCPDCNGKKLGDRPSEAQVQALIDRNDAILRSPHPLKRTLTLSLGLATPSGHDVGFYRAVDAAGLGA